MLNPPSLAESNHQHTNLVSPPNVFIYQLLNLPSTGASLPVSEYFTKRLSNPTQYIHEAKTAHGHTSVFHALPLAVLSSTHSRKYSCTPMASQIPELRKMMQGGNDAGCHLFLLTGDTTAIPADDLDIWTFNDGYPHLSGHEILDITSATLFALQVVMLYLDAFPMSLVKLRTVTVLKESRFSNIDHFYQLERYSQN